MAEGLIDKIKHIFSPSPEHGSDADDIQNEVPKTDRQGNLITPPPKKPKEQSLENLGDRYRQAESHSPKFINGPHPNAPSVAYPSEPVHHGPKHINTLLPLSDNLSMSKIHEAGKNAWKNGARLGPIHHENMGTHSLKLDYQKMVTHPTKHLVNPGLIKQGSKNFGMKDVHMRDPGVLKSEAKLIKGGNMSKSTVLPYNSKPLGKLQGSHSTVIGRKR